MNTDEALKAAVMQVAQAKVAEALGGDILGKMVESVMQHTDRRYGETKSQTEFERIVNQLLHSEITSAAREVLAERREEITASVRAAIQKDGFDKLAVSIVDAFASDDWRASLAITIDRPRKED